MTFLRCFTLATALFLSPLATPHHVVFEEIEEIETAIKQLYSSIKNGHAAWISYSSLDFARDQFRATLTQIRHSLAVEKRSSIWKYIFSLLGIAIFTTVSIILGYILFTRYYFTLRQRFIDWVMHILSESVRALILSLSPPEANA